MNLDILHKVADKFLNQMLRGRYSIDYDLTTDDELTKENGIPMFNLRILVDPEKYHWSGVEYNSKYVKIVDYIEDNLDRILKYIGLTTDNFNRISLRFDPEKTKNLYKKILPKIPGIWKKFQEGVHEVQIPDLKSIDLIKRSNGDYDLKFILDKNNLSNEEFQEIVDDTFHTFFVYADKNGLPMDSHYIEFT
jgi:hypothetical protein